jgi:hypothetical protein
MTEYSPFLKFKANELIALINLLPEDRKNIIPLLELPRDDSYTVNDLISRIDNSVKKMKKKIENNFSFYIDNLEIPDIFKIHGSDNYQYLINSFIDFDIIPVVGFDRVKSHNDIGINFANKKAKKIAIRVTQDYFENFLAYKKDLSDMFAQIEQDVTCILLLDCNYIEDGNVTEKCKICIIKILEYITKTYKFSKIVISGSSIPTPIGDKVKAGTTVNIDRNEISLFNKIKIEYPEIALVLGDYTVVSPGYSEINIKPEAMQNVIKPKIIYSTLNYHYAIRGQKLKTHGFGQYFLQAEAIIKESFYREKDFSWGDNFLFEKATYKGTNITPSSIIGPTVNAHIKFMINEIKSGSI